MRCSVRGAGRRMLATEEKGKTGRPRTLGQASHVLL